MTTNALKVAELLNLAKSYETEYQRTDCGARQIDLDIAARRARAQAAYWARRDARALDSGEP